MFQISETNNQQKKGADCYFIFPPLSASERYGSREIPDTEGHLPPLGILFCAAVLEKHGFTCKVLDGPVSGMDCGQAAEVVIKENPSVVCISSITATFYRAKELAEKIKANLPDVPVFTGGHHATIAPNDVMSSKGFDIAVFNEGELTFLELMQEFRKDNDFFKKPEKLNKIKGIYYRDGDKLVKTEARPVIQNLDELPFAARHLIDMKKYKPLANQYKRLPATNFVSIRGCPYVCSFCSNPAIFGHKIRAMSPGRVIAELKFLKEAYGIREISFWDDIFTADRKWAMEVCDKIIQEKLDITWSCYCRVNTVDPELLKKMKKAGCWNIFFGLEAGNQQLLNNIRKGATLQQIRDAIKWTNHARIETRGSFILGLPGETPELAKQTIEFAKTLDLDYAQFCIDTPFPGTELYATAEKWGTLKKEYDKFNIWTPVFVPFGYKDAKEIEAMERYAMRSFYLRPKYIAKRIIKIRSFWDIKRAVDGLKLVMGFIKGAESSRV